MQETLNGLKSINRGVWLILGVAVIAVVAFLLLNSPHPPVQVHANNDETVKVITGDLSEQVITSGLLMPQRDVHLSMGASGIVAAVEVEVGDSVKKGDVLVRLDDAIARENANKADLAVQLAQVTLDSAQHDYDKRVTWLPNQHQVNAAEAAVADAEAAVKAAQSAYDKVAYLPSISSMPQSVALEQATNAHDLATANLAYLYSNRPDIVVALNNLEVAKLTLSSAQADQRVAQETLSRMTLVAPFDGTITAVNVDVGEATTGPIAELVTMDALDVVLDVDEVDVGALHVGDPATVTFDAWPGVEVKAKVISIAPQANAMANVVNFEVHLGLEATDLDLRAGMTANAVIEGLTVKDVLLVPNEAIFQDMEAGTYYVYRVTAQGPQKTEITIGVRGNNYTQIVSGLSAGDDLLASEPPSETTS